MDANHFLGQRLELITVFYRQGAAPFLATMQAIEDGTGEWANPPYSEDAGPVYELEYNQARACLLLLGTTAITSIAGSLQLFLDTMVKLYGDKAHYLKSGAEGGWWGKHQRYFAARGLDFAKSGANITLLTDVVLARNSVQHQEFLTSDRASYRDEDLAKLGNPFFINESEAAMLKDLGDEATPYLYAPTIELDEAKLVIAVSEVKKLTSWLETSIWEMLRPPSFMGPIVNSKS